MLELVPYGFATNHSFAEKPEQRFTCNCTHRIQRHLRFAGCKDCPCEQYNQTKQVLNPLWSEDAETDIGRNDAPQEVVSTEPLPVLRKVAIP